MDSKFMMSNTIFIYTQKPHDETFMKYTKKHKADNQEGENLVSVMSWKSLNIY